MKISSHKFTVTGRMLSVITLIFLNSTLLLQVCSAETPKEGALAAFSSSPLSSTKKIIEYGWDVPTAEFTRQNIRQMETQPFDGIIFKIEDTFSLAFDTRPWTEDEMRLDALSAIEWDKFTDNFLILHSANQNGMDWFNDAHWQTIAANMRLFGRAAKTAGCVGITFDPEPYGPSPWQYSTSLYPGKSFSQVETQVRQRGAQWLSAIQTEFPHPQILSFYLLSIVRVEANDDPANIPYTDYALLRAFLEGMLDVASPDTRIIEGNEFAYYYDETNKYFDDYAWLKDIPAGFISLENQTKFAEQVEIGMALYMDNVLVQPFLGTVTFPEAYRQIWWQHNVYYALATTDEYVWCYSEQMDWWRNNVFTGGEEGIISAKELYFQGSPLGFDLYKNPEDYRDYDVPGTAITSPAINIAGPAYGVHFTAPATITLTATTTGNNIERIEFYTNSQMVKVNSNAVGYTWTNLPTGAYTFLARVFDTNGRHGTSGSLRVNVTNSNIYLPIIVEQFLR